MEFNTPGSATAMAAAITPDIPLQGGYKTTAFDQVFTDLTRLRGVCWMLIRCVGDLPEAERPGKGHVPTCVQYLASSLDQIVAIMDEMEPGLATFSERILFARAIAWSLDAMLWSDAQDIHGSDEMMSGLIDAISGCIDEAYEEMNAPPAQQSEAALATVQPVHPTPRGEKVKAHAKARVLEVA